MSCFHIFVLGINQNFENLYINRVIPAFIVIGGFVPIATVDAPDENTNITFTNCCKSLNPDKNKCSFVTSKYECSSYEYFKDILRRDPNYFAWIYVPLSFISFILIVYN